jgi:hypothetical protein
MGAGWLDRQFRAIKDDARTWPEWMRKGDTMGETGLDRATYMLRGLLAMIHRDDGSYTADHGIEKSWEDAKARVGRLNGLEDGIRGRARRHADRPTGHVDLF